MTAAAGARPSMVALQARVFALTWLSYATYYLTRKNFGIAKTYLEDELGISVQTLGLIDTSMLAAYALGQFVMGSLGDALGARRMIAFGMIASAVTALVFGLSSWSAVFGIAFGINGLFQATGWPNNVKAMAPWFATRQRGKVMGFWCTNYQVGGIAATALATFVAATFGWRWAFFVPAVVVAAVGVVCLLLLVEKPQDRGLEPIEPAEEPARSAATTTGDVARDEGKKSKAAFLEMLAIPRLWVLGLTYFGLKLIRYSLLFWLPYYLERVLHYPRETAGYLSTPFEIGGVVGAIATGWLSDRLAPNNRMRVAAPMIIGLAGALALFQAVGGLGMFANAASMALCGFLLFGPDALISGAAAQDVGGARAAGSAAGIINGIGSLGAVLQGLITAWIAETPGLGWGALFYMFVGLALLSGFGLLPLAFGQRTAARA
ncbi:MAG: MFS transporter [Deltaproteobacteria bacterium]|nr:MFS transporter [Deltaproteobacteria bacterium]